MARPAREGLTALMEGIVPEDSGGEVTPYFHVFALPARYEVVRMRGEAGCYRQGKTTGKSNTDAGDPYGSESAMERGKDTACDANLKLLTTGRRKTPPQEMETRSTDQCDGEMTRESSNVLPSPDNYSSPVLERQEVKQNLEEKAKI